MNMRQFAVLQFIACDQDERDYWSALYFVSGQRRPPRVTPALPRTRLVKLASYMRRVHGAPTSTSLQVRLT